jgi:acyl carrier protein
MKDTEPAHAQGHFRAKAQGLYVLGDVLRGHPLDFCLLVSSLASVLGGLGLGAYAAANVFMDTFAHRHNQSEPGNWLSVNWDAWQPTAAKYADVGFPFAELSITPVEGADAFQRILTLTKGAVTQVLVSTSNLQARIDQWLAPPGSPGDVGRAAGEEMTAHVPRPNLQNAYVAPRNEVEREIVEVWQEVLGIQQVGVYDNFFELGGNSLAGIQLIARLKEELGVQIPVVSLYEGPTVNTLSKIIVQIRGDGADGEAAHEADRARGQRQRDKLRRRRRG